MAISTSGKLPDDLAESLARLCRADRAADDAEFDEVALRLHAYQMQCGGAFARYAEQFDNARPSSWRDIVGLPTQAFKLGFVSCHFQAEVPKYFRTSGTTADHSGLHYYVDTSLYDQTARANFLRHVLGGRRGRRMFLLLPSPSEAPHSSLVYMSKVLSDAFGTKADRWYVRDGELRAAALFDDLTESQKAGEGVVMLGTAFAWVHFIDAMRGCGSTLRLGPKSVVVETGGFKGRSRELSRSELYDDIAAALGVPVQNIINEYGMTELFSQFYDESLLTGESSEWKVCPGSARVLAMDPVQQVPVLDGEPGLLRIVDLANAHSAMAIQTEDVGVLDGMRFRVLGRVGKAPPRGCSLAAEGLAVRRPL